MARAKVHIQSGPGHNFGHHRQSLTAMTAVFTATAKNSAADTHLGSSAMTLAAVEKCLDRCSNDLGHHGRGLSR